jgi:hypothetical protein
MRNVTLSADEDLIERARVIAQSRHTTLNDAFREWLAQYSAEAGTVEEFDALLARLRRKVEARGPYSREEMNER